MKAIYTVKALALFAFLLAAPILQAQEENTNSLNRELTLEREYDPTVQDANKVNTLPTIKEPVVRNIPIDYSNFTLPASPEKEVTILPSGKIMTEIDFNKRRGFLNLGAGTYLNLNGDLGYKIVDTAKDRLSFSFSHRSTNGNVKYLHNDEKVKAKINDNLGALNYSHAFDNAVFHIGANYGYSAFNYYGYPFPSFYLYLPGEGMPGSVSTDTETKQVAQTIKAYTGVQSMEGSETGYQLNVDYTNFSYKYGISPEADGPTEHAIGVSGDLNRELATDQRFGVSAKLNYFNYSQPSPVTHPSGMGTYETNFDNYAEITLSPYYRIHGGSWNVNLGANIMFITSGDHKFMATPNVMADVTIADNTVLYASATGQLQSNSMQQLSQMNRYIDPTNAIAPTRHQLNAVAGVKTGAIPGMTLDLFGGYNIMKDDVLFIPRLAYYDGDFGNMSQSLGNVDFNHTFIGASIQFSYQKYFDFLLRGVYNMSDISQADVESMGIDDIPPFGRPKYDVTAMLTLRPIPKTSIIVDYTLGKDRCTLYANDIMPLDDIHELNISGTYAFNDTFGFYLKLNNMLFQKYDIYYGYPAQGFNVMAGINLNF